MALDLHRKYIEKKQDSAPLVPIKDIVNSKYYLDPLELLGERSFNAPREINESEVGTPIQEFFRDAVVLITGGTGFMGKVLIEKLLRTCPHIKHVYLLIRSKKGKNVEQRLEDIFEDRVGTPIQEFFRDAVVLITGGTGFMGKVLIEKLLRTCPHIKHVYLLIRSKKGKNVEQRLEDIFEDRLFKRLKHEVPKYHHKISGIAGDCGLPGLGLSVTSRNTLINEVTIVFHGAATVRFDEHIRIAMSINVSGTREMLNLCRKITNLKVLAHVSTAFSNCNRLLVEEKFYEPIANFEDVLELVSSKDDQTLQDMTPDIIGSFPNTYAFTKSLAEDVIRREAKDLPMLVFRPTVVIATYREPVRGWIDNVYGPTGLIVGVGSGVLHTYYGDSNTITDMVPVDMVVNALICSAKEVATEKLKDIPIFTCSSSRQKPVRWIDFIEMNRRHGIYWPTIRAIWYYSFVPTNNIYIYLILKFMCHIIPGFILDTLAVLAGQKPILLKIYKKIDKVRDILAYFSDKEWTFINDRTLKLWETLDSQDKELFNFDIHQLSWESFSQAHCLGLRVYLVKDDIHTLPSARKRWERLQLAHKALMAFVYGIVLWLAWTILSFVFKLFV